MVTRMIHLACAVVVLSVSALAQSASAGTGETIVVGVPLHRGLTREQVVKQLGEHYQLVKVGTIGETWLVRAADSTEVSYGSVVFDKDVLASASRNLTISEIDTISFARIISSKLADFSDEGKVSCNLRTMKLDAQLSRTQSVTLVCGSRALVLTITEVTTTDLMGKNHMQQRADIQERLLPLDGH